jgi:small subunit ribosomal protein S8e
MTEWHTKSKRKKTGAIRHSKRRSDKILAWKGGPKAESIVAAQDKRKTVEGRGNTKKVKLKSAKQASVTIPGEKKAVKAEIIAVAENKANRLYTRRNIVTKGAVIRVKIGEKEHTARVTSRPGQNGVVQAVLEK